MWNIFSSLFNPTGRAGEGEVKLCAISNLWEGNEGGWQTATYCTIPESTRRHLKVQLRNTRCFYLQPGSLLCLRIFMLAVHAELLSASSWVVKRPGKLSSMDKALKAAICLLLLAVASRISHFLLPFWAAVCVCENFLASPTRCWELKHEGEAAFFLSAMYWVASRMPCF